MKKRVLAMVLAAAMCMTMLPVMAADETEEIPISEEQKTAIDPDTAQIYESGDYLYYIREDETAGIYYYTGTDTSVVIPDELDGYQVTEIDERAFWVETMITDVVIPEGVEKIGSYAFASWEDGQFYETALKSVTIPSTVRVIGDHAFCGATELTSLTLPEGVEEIGWGAFAYCFGLQDFTIPASVTTIGDGPFAGCLSMEEIRVADGSEYFASYDGCLYDKALTRLYAVPAAKTSVVLPDTLTMIGNIAFEACYYINEVILPDGVTDIDVAAFMDSGITGIVIPDGVTELKDYTFLLCANLESVTIPASVATFGEDVFTETSEDLVLRVYEGSQAEAYAIENGIRYELIVDDDAVFSDISENDWFYNEVMYVNEKGLMTGMNATTFGPYETLSRAQFAVILHRMNETPEMTYLPTFPDVPSGYWFTDAVLWANKANIVTGYSNGYFGTSDAITREQMALMMYRYAKYKEYSVGGATDFSRFTDAWKVSSFAKEAMQWAVGNGIITGKSNGTILDPQGIASRAECAIIIKRFVEKYEN